MSSLTLVFKEGAEKEGNKGGKEENKKLRVSRPQGFNYTSDMSKGCSHIAKTDSTELKIQGLSGNC